MIPLYSAYRSRMAGRSAATTAAVSTTGVVPPLAAGSRQQNAIRDGNDCVFIASTEPMHANMCQVAAALH